MEKLIQIRDEDTTNFLKFSHENFIEAIKLQFLSVVICKDTGVKEILKNMRYKLDYIVRECEQDIFIDEDDNIVLGTNSFDVLRSFFEEDV